MLKDEEIGKERQGSFSSLLCFKYLFCLCAGPLASYLEKGTSNMKCYKPSIMQTVADVFYIPVITSYLVGTEKLLGHGPHPVLSPLWQWLVLDISRCTGVRGLLGQNFSSPTDWAASAALAQNCQSLGGGTHSSAEPPYPQQKSAFPWSQALLPLCPSRHLDFYPCWSSFQSCESISAVPLLKAKHNQDRLFLKIIFKFLKKIF